MAYGSTAAWPDGPGTHDTRHQFRYAPVRISLSFTPVSILSFRHVSSLSDYFSIVQMAQMIKSSKCSLSASVRPRESLAAVSRPATVVRTPALSVHSVARASFNAAFGKIAATRPRTSSSNSSVAAAASAPSSSAVETKVRHCAFEPQD